jgi:hypothetical protein
MRQRVAKGKIFTSTLPDVSALCINDVYGCTVTGLEHLDWLKLVVIWGTSATDTPPCTQAFLNQVVSLIECLSFLFTSA